MKLRYIILGRILATVIGTVIAFVILRAIFGS